MKTVTFEEWANGDNYEVDEDGTKTREDFVASWDRARFNFDIIELTKEQVTFTPKSKK